MSRRERTVARRAAARAGRNNSGCLLGLALLPLVLVRSLLSYSRGSGGIGPRSTHRLLGPSHRSGGGGGSRHNKGCGLFLFGLLALPVAAGMAAVAGWWTS